MTIETPMWLNFLNLRPAFAPEDEGGAGGAGGDGEGTGDDTTGDGGAAGDDDADDGVALGGQTASGQDKSDEGSSDDDADGDGGDDKNATDDKDGDADDETVPDEYTFDILPEGVEVDEALASVMTPVFKDLGLTQTQANKLTEAYAGIAAQNAENSAKEITDMVKGWKDAAMKDKEIGQNNWTASVDTANAVIRRFGTEEFINDFLVGQGNGNHPELIRFIARVGAHFKDDEFITGKETDTSEPVPAEARWYGNTTPDTKKG
jgi:hypothetical protein